MAPDHGSGRWFILSGQPVATLAELLDRDLGLHSAVRFDEVLGGRRQCSAFVGPHKEGAGAVDARVASEGCAVGEDDLRPLRRGQRSPSLRGKIRRSWSRLRRRRATGVRLRSPAASTGGEQEGESCDYRGVAPVAFCTNRTFGLHGGRLPHARGRIIKNADVFGFTLDAAAMESLDALDEGLATGWDPRAGTKRLTVIRSASPAP